jgi:putative FmdB family regulatory protein
VPTYDYECGACGARLESFESADTDMVTCVECGAEEAQRQITSFGLISRQPTANQRRRMEDARGTNRDGARKRFGESLAKNRKKES